MPPTTLGALLTRNTLINLMGQAIPLSMAVISTPVVVRGLGAERFGILAVGWVLLAQWSLLDLGMGRALTRWVAGLLAEQRDGELPALVWTAVAAQLVLGALGLATFIGAVQLLARHLLDIPGPLLDEGMAALRLIGIAVPLVLLSTVLRSVVEATQRFDLVNLVATPFNVLLYAAPMIGVLAGFRLPGIVVLVLVLKLLTCVAFLLLALHALPALRLAVPLRARVLRPLLGYGAWIALTNALGPLNRYADRLAIGSSLGVAAVAYYSVPFDAVEQLGLLQSSLMLTLFPAFPALGTADGRAGRLCVRASKYLLLSAGPLFLLLALFAPQILGLWLGPAFAEHATPAFRVLLVGAVIGLLAPAPVTALQALGRPDILAKLLLACLVPNLVLVWLCVAHFGVLGAAVLVAARWLVVNYVVFHSAARLTGMSLTVIRQERLPASLAWLGGLGATFWLVSFSGGPWAASLLAAGALAVFLPIAWIGTLEPAERHAVLAAASRRSSGT